MKRIRVKILSKEQPQLFQNWADQYYQKKERLVGKSQRDSLLLAFKYLSPLSGKPIDRITEEDCSQILDRMYLQGYHKRTIQLARITGKAVFDLAISHGAVLSNPMAKVRINSKAVTKKIEPITEQEEQLLWSPPFLSAENRLDQNRTERFAFIRLWALIQLSCGLRKEETGALEWKDVSLSARQIHICQAYNYKTNEIKAPKTEAGNRYIGIPERLEKELTAWQQLHPGERYVFELNGRPITQSQFRRLWQVLMDGINGYTISEKISMGYQNKELRYRYYFTSHQLRHTFATNALDAGLNLRILQYLMGHETPEMTLKYTHVSRRNVLAEIEKIEKTKSA